jgi:hypothetical protein
MIVTPKSAIILALEAMFSECPWAQDRVHLSPYASGYVLTGLRLQRERSFFPKTKKG